MDQDVPQFEALIVPHRSLSSRTLAVLLGVLALLCCATTGVMVWRGAWPVAGFTGAELLLAAVLFRHNARGVRESELVLLSDAGLRIIRTDAKGRRRERVLPPAWLGVRLTDRPGRVPMLTLAARDLNEEVGRCLGEAEKRDLAAALEAALHRFRHPSFENPQLGG
jgi:uncharacterized membrane protein